MTNKEIIDWVNGEFDNFEINLANADKHLIRIFGDHYRNVCLTAIRKLHYHPKK